MWHVIISYSVVEKSLWHSLSDLLNKDIGLFAHNFFFFFWFCCFVPIIFGPRKLSNTHTVLKF